MKVPTIKIEDKKVIGGYRIINESDYDSNTHRLFDENKKRRRVKNANQKSLDIGDGERDGPTDTS